MSSANSRDDVIIRTLADADYPVFGPRIAALERGITYPLGDDRFSIDHGADYFAFFRRMGALTYVVATRGGDVLGAVAAVERESEDWYIGDLKVTDLGRGLARRLMRELDRCDGPRRIYGISMNPGDGSENRVVRMLTRARPELRKAAQLHFYTFESAENRGIDQLLRTLRDHRGSLGFLSLRGTKDIVLASTGLPMALTHVQFGPFADPVEPDPRPGFTNMFCAPAGDPLDLAVRDLGMKPMATATIVQMGMPDRDWSFVLSSDI